MSGQASNSSVTIKQMTLQARLAKVVAETSAVPKAGFNPQQNYRYATAGDVLEMVRLALTRNGVLLTMHPGDPHLTELPREGKLPMICCRLPVTFSFWDVQTREALEIRWPAEAQDIGDKAIAKALTAAQKTFLLKTFLLPSLDDDSDAPPPNAGRAARPPARRSQAPPPGVDPATGEAKGAQPARKGDPRRRINENQLRMIRSRLAEANVSDEEACAKTNVSRLEDLTNELLDGLLDWLRGGTKP